MSNDNTDIEPPPTLPAVPPVTLGAVVQAPPEPPQKPTPKKPRRTAKGVTSSGAVVIANEEKLRGVPLYFYAERSQWYQGDGHGGFTRIGESSAKTYLAMHGYNKSIKDTDGNTLAERAMLWIVHNKKVSFAGAVAGYPAGVHESGHIRFLVTEAPSIVHPRPGNCSTIRELCESLFFDETTKQGVCFYLWASESFKAYYARIAKRETNSFRHCPALAIFGPRGCGKSALIDLVLTPLFGGKNADPMSYLKDPKFNKDLFGASLLVLDDKGASANLADRRQRGESIKGMIWKPEQRMEAKGADALTLRPFWRLVIAGNDDDGGLQVCPALTESLKDKLLILKAAQAVGLPDTHEKNDAWARQIQDELPAFAHYLLNWCPPQGVELDPRTRVASFWHPQIVSMLRELQPEMRLVELIDTLGLIESPAIMWEGTATEFQSAMMKLDGTGILDRLFAGSTSAGRMLSELSRVCPERVKRTDRDGRSWYRIHAKAPQKEKTEMDSGAVTQEKGTL